MTEPTPPAEQSEPATGPVYTPPSSSAPHTPAGPHTPAAAPAGPSQSGPFPAPAPQTVYVAAPPSRLNKVAAWVGIAAGSVFIVAVIFGTGFFVGKEVSGGGHHPARAQQMNRPDGPLFPMGRGEYQRGPAYTGPFGPGPIIAIPQPSDGSGVPGGQGGQGSPPR